MCNIEAKKIWYEIVPSLHGNHCLAAQIKENVSPKNPQKSFCCCYCKNVFIELHLIAQSNTCHLKGKKIGREFCMLHGSFSHIFWGPIQLNYHWLVKTESQGSMEFNRLALLTFLLIIEKDTWFSACKLIDNWSERFLPPPTVGN